MQNDGAGAGSPPFGVPGSTPLPVARRVAPEPSLTPPGPPAAFVGPAAHRAAKPRTTARPTPRRQPCTGRRRGRRPLLCCWGKTLRLPPALVPGCSTSPRRSLGDAVVRVPRVQPSTHLASRRQLKPRPRPRPRRQLPHPAPRRRRLELTQERRHRLPQRPPTRRSGAP